MKGNDILHATELSTAFYDSYPVSPGHCLIVPKRHVESFFDLTPAEQGDLFALVPSLKKILDEKWAPAAYNLGMNMGRAAGQTVPHTHLHLIPRFPNDVADPRGGVRWVIPDLPPKNWSRLRVRV
jgi:diadenosine tetraphosphate (Ap4A) HIT family hydrolase